MENLINNLRFERRGYGQYIISAEIDGKNYNCHTTNSMAIDAAFDDYYDDEDNSGRFFESQLEAKNTLVNEIIRANDIML